MINLGDFAVGQTVTRRFTTADQSGLPVTLAGSPVARVRKGTGAGSVITAGVTLTVDSPVTGQHVIDIDTSASASYTAAGEYTIELSAGTVSGISIAGTVIAQFSLADRLDRVGAAGASLTSLGDTRIANLDVAASSLATAANLATAKTELDAVKAKTDNLPASPAATGDIPSAAAIGAQVTSDHGAGSYIRNTEPDNATIAAIAAKLPAGNMADEALVIAATDAIMTSLGTVATQASVNALAASEASEGVKKNQARANFEFFMADSTDHVTGKTGLTISAKRSIDGGAFAPCANSAVEVSNGIYKINLAASDLNGDSITFRFSGTGADDALIGVITEL